LNGSSGRTAARRRERFGGDAGARDGAGAVRARVEELDAIEAELRPQLPLGERVKRVVLFERGGDRRWVARSAFELDARR